jgi:hypothetical protein
MNASETVISADTYIDLCQREVQTSHFRQGATVFPKKKKKQTLKTENVRHPTHVKRFATQTTDFSRWNGKKGETHGKTGNK